MDKERRSRGPGFYHSSKVSGGQQYIPYYSWTVEEGWAFPTFCCILNIDTHLPLMALKSRIPSAGPQIWTKSSRDIFSKSAPEQANRKTCYMLTQRKTLSLSICKTYIRDWGSGIGNIQLQSQPQLCGHSVGVGGERECDSKELDSRRLLPGASEVPGVHRETDGTVPLSQDSIPPTLHPWQGLRLSGVF